MTIQVIAKLSGIDEATGEPALVEVDCQLLSVPRRSLGPFDSPVIVQVRASEWPSVLGVTFDLHSDFRLRIGTEVQHVTLGGYWITRVERIALGTPIAGGAVAPQLVRLTLSLKTSVQRASGRGGLIRERVYNPTDASGRVDIDHPDFRSMSALITLAASATGLDFVVPASVNTLPAGAGTVTPPGPLDFGNARALDELDGLLGYIGWASGLSNSGTSLIIAPLARPGTPIVLPPDLAAAAEPYFLAMGPAARARTIVVTSGRTRATVLTWRSLAPGIGGQPALEWVAFDDRTARHLNALEWSTLYGPDNPDRRETDDVVPGDVQAWKSGPLGPDAESGSHEWAAAHARIFSALRLTGDDAASASRFVVLPEAVALQSIGADWAAAPAVLYARGAAADKQSTFVNEPIADPVGAVVIGEDTRRWSGVIAVSGEGVFRLPPDLAWVRMSPGPAGTFAEAVPLSGTDLVIVFAHESDTGSFTEDFFVAGFSLTQEAGVYSVAQLDPAALAAAIDDPATVKIEADWLRSIGVIDPSTPTVLTRLNDAELSAVAEELALLRAGDLDAEYGVIRLRGFFDVQPGDLAGAVTAVSWDLSQGITALEVNQHEAPTSLFTRLQAIAGRSVATGLTGRSAVTSSSLVRQTRSAPRQDRLVGGGEAGPEPEHRGSVRGGERAAANPSVASREARQRTSAMPMPSTELAGRGIFARITGATQLTVELPEPVPAAKWAYDWEQVVPAPEGGWRVAGVSSLTHGKAYNGTEAGNGAADAIGVQGTGIDTANLPGTFEHVPVGVGAIVELHGPFSLKPDGQPAFAREWRFFLTIHVDGDCEAPA